MPVGVLCRTNNPTVDLSMRLSLNGLLKAASAIILKNSSFMLCLQYFAEKNVAIFFMN